MNAPSENACRSCDGRGWYAANGYTSCKICDGTGTIAPPTAPSLGLTLYIAGPMTGLPEFNYPAFNAAATKLRAVGYTVLNPAENPKPCQQPEWLDWMRSALALLIKADAVATLPGWNLSRGARVEVELAIDLGIPHDPVERHLHVAAKMAGTR